MVLNAHISVVSYLFVLIFGWIYLAYFYHQLDIIDYLLRINVLGFELLIGV